MAHVASTLVELASSSGTYTSNHDERERKKWGIKHKKVDIKCRYTVV